MSGGILSRNAAPPPLSSPCLVVGIRVEFHIVCQMLANIFEKFLAKFSLLLVVAHTLKLLFSRRRDDALQEDWSKVRLL